MVSFCCVMVSLRFAMSHAISSRFVPLSLPPPEKSKLGVLLVPVKVAVFPLRLFSPLVTRLNSEIGGEPSCRKEHVACWGRRANLLAPQPPDQASVLALSPFFTLACLLAIQSSSLFVHLVPSGLGLGSVVFVPSYFVASH